MSRRNDHLSAEAASARRWASLFDESQRQAAEAWDRIDRENAAEAAAAERAASAALAARRREYELEFAAEVADMAERRGHPGRPDTHDVALAQSAVAYRFGQTIDHEAKRVVLESDPEPVGADYRPLRFDDYPPLGGASAMGDRSTRRLGPPADDRAFGDRLAAATAGFEDLARLRRRDTRGRLTIPTTSAQRLRAIRAAIDALLPASGWS
jgi:hypothetical protein